MFYLSDVDECLPDQISDEYSHLAHNCDADANCTNTKGSFYCTCHTGYSGDGVTCVGKVNFIYLSATNPNPFYLFNIRIQRKRNDNNIKIKYKLANVNKWPLRLETANDNYGKNTNQIIIW